MEFQIYKFQKFCWPLCPDTFAYVPHDLKRIPPDIRAEILKELHVMERETELYNYMNVNI
jgi:hypothetical protein